MRANGEGDTGYKGAEPIWSLAPKPVLSNEWADDGNAYWLLGHAHKAQQRAGWTKEQSDAWRAEATSVDYGHLLRTIFKWHEMPDDEDE